MATNYTNFGSGGIKITGEAIEDGLSITSEYISVIIYQNDQTKISNLSNRRWEQLQNEMLNKPRPESGYITNK